MTSLFTNTHLRSSHHLAPQPLPTSQPPPSSFSRASGVRSQLKKIPSSLFNKENKATNVHNEPARNFLASLSPKRNKAASTLAPSVAPTKIKTGKTRKALADILGWGNHNPNNRATPPAITRKPSTSNFGPPLPAKENMPHVLKKRASRPLSGKSSQSGLSGYASLRVAQETPQTRARPSMGADPFSRRGVGAEVVDSIERKYNVGTSVKSSIASDKRGSVASSKAFSSKTLIGDEESTRERAPVPTTLDRAGSQASSRHISAPMPLHAVLQEVPPRTASLGRMLEHNLPTPPPSATFVEKKGFQADYKALKKEKTRSRVWGIFGGKKKEKNKVDSPEPKPRHAFEVRPVDAPFGSRELGTVKSSHSSSTLSSAHHLSEISSASGVNRSLVSSRPRPPIVHVQQPSTEITASTSRPQSLKPLPPVIQSVSKPATADVNRASTVSAHNRMFESVVGSSPERPSVEGARYDIVAAYRTKSRAIPKRKSLTGVFGVAFRRSLDKIKPSGSRSSLKAVNEDPATLRGPPSAFNGATLRSLAEEMESAEGASIVVQAPSMPYQSRFGDRVLKAKGSFQKSTGDLRRVASATDKLSTLVSLDFSPSPQKTPSDHDSIAAPPSLASLDGSPTPMRRVRSAVLTSKKSAASPTKSTISPLKLALHRSQVAAKPKSPISVPSSPPKTTSLVRKGMRNIFAPPTPPRQPELLTMTSKMDRDGPPVRDLSDMPADLHAIIKAAPAASPDKRATLGLPPLPPSNRVSPRRNNGRAPPAHSLPPVPDLPSQYTPGRVSPVPPQLTLNLMTDLERTSIFSDVLSIGDDNRMSFDFTNEYASLDLGHQRASFVEAVAEVANRPQVPLPPPPTLSSVEEKRESVQSFDEVSEMLHDATPQSDTDDEDDEVEEQLEMEIATAVVQRTPRLSAVPTPRKSPFQGQAAFQKHVAQSRVTPPIEEKPVSAVQPFSFVSVPTEVEIPTRQGRRHHQRDQSGFSIASMSSVGSVIETGIAGDYSNYFEVNFANHLASQASSHSRNQSAHSTVSRRGSRDSFARHHRRNSSIISVESINEELSAVLRGVGPPVSLHNARRASYISRHRRGESGESFGRSDWAAHRRNTSTESTSSNISLARLGRPGLGERMFQLDGGVQLTSITGSPADAEAPSPELSPAPVRSSSNVAKKWSYNSVLDGDTSAVKYNSLFDMSNRTLTDSLFDSSSPKADSIFGGGPIQMESKFTLRGARPDSVASTATTTRANEDQDTFRAYGGCEMSPIPKGATTCLEADGEDDTMTRSMNVSTNSNRQILTMSRPAKPRRRPANLVFGSTSTAQPDTPALSSPSASETSSRISLETKFSDVASIFSATRVRPLGAGHARQKSSAQVKLQATIKEEPSHATLRAKAQRQRVEPAIVDYDDTPPETIRSWLEWKREADDEYKRMKAYGQDTEVDDVLAFKLPTSISEIEDFIAKSNAAYKPLDQMPLGRHIPHRRKSSLSESRQLLSPYGLPLPKPPAHPSQYKPKMSLQTKFERTQKSSTGSYLTVDGDAHSGGGGTPVSANGSTPSRPMSAMFAQFTREITPTPSPALGSLPFSPFAIPLSTLRAGQSTSPRPKTERTDTYAGTTERQRVPSGARRAALGWGRRRNSDGPTKVEQMARQYEAKADALEGLPRDLRAVVCASSDKENRSGGGAGKRSLPPMAISGQNQLNRPVQPVHPALSKIPVPARSKLDTTSATAQSKRNEGSMQSVRKILAEQKSNAALSASKLPTAKKSKLTIKEGRSTGLQIFEDKPTSNKVVLPKVSSRKARPANVIQPGRGVRV